MHFNNNETFSFFKIWCRCYVLSSNMLFWLFTLVLMQFTHSIVAFFSVTQGNTNCYRRGVLYFEVHFSEVKRFVVFTANLNKTWEMETMSR